MIAYPDTGFLVSLYGEDNRPQAATELVESHPVFILTSLGEAEFINALELRVFRKKWMRQEARPDVFFTFDNRHSQLAKAEGLRALPG